MALPKIIENIDNRVSAINTGGDTMKGALRVNEGLGQLNAYTWDDGATYLELYAKEDDNNKRTVLQLNSSPDENGNPAIRLLFRDEDLNVTGVSALYGQHNKPTPADIGALPLTGGTLSGGKISLKNGKGYISASNTLDITIHDTENDANNRRILSIYDKASKAELKDSLLYVSIVDGKMSTYTLYGQHNKPTASDVGALSLSGGVITGPVDIRGNAASKPFKVRGIVGQDGNGTVGDLYLQYEANSKLYLGNNAAYTISADGGQYTGNSATATKATQDGSGNTITSTYLPVTNGTLKGNLNLAPSMNFKMTPTQNGSEWSFDFQSSSYTGCYWHVWDASKSSLLSVYQDDGRVQASYNFQVNGYYTQNGTTGGIASMTSSSPNTKMLWAY